MSDIRYSVEHENHSPSLVSHFKYLMQMKILVDTTLVCDSNMLKVHKVVLAAASSYFQDVFKEKPGELIFKLKMNFDVLRYIVEFMYSGKTSFLDVHRGELLSAARYLKIWGLMELILDNTGSLPEFITPIIINQPVNIKQDTLQTLQMPINDHQLDSLLVRSSQNNTNDITVVVHIPIEICKSHGKQEQSRLLKCPLDDEGFSNRHEKLKSINEQKLLKPVARKLKNVEECSIKTIRKLNTLQKKQLEISKAFCGITTLRSNNQINNNDQQIFINPENNNIDKMELLHPFYKENYSPWMINQGSLKHVQINKNNRMVLQYDSNLNCNRLSANVENFPRLQQTASDYNLQMSTDGDLTNGLLPLPSENCHKHNNKSGSNFLKSKKNSQHRVKRWSNKFDEQNLVNYEYSPAAQDTNPSIEHLELSNAVNSIFDQKFQANSVGYNTASEMSNLSKREHLEVYAPFFNEKTSGCIIDQDYSKRDKEVLMASQCEHVLKAAGLPTDVPILYKSQDGSYLNLTGETLLDMVQNNTIEFEVIERMDLIDENETSEC